MGCCALRIGADVGIGYSGMTLASAIGIPLAVADPRIRAAIFGGVFTYDAVIEAAGRVTIPRDRRRYAGVMSPSFQLRSKYGWSGP
jgi:hypothetical protein